MRKKLMSVLLALVMVIGIIPAAFAAQLTDAQKKELKDKGYTDAQIEAIDQGIADYEGDEVMLVFEDTTISTAESRLVVVVAPKAVVTVEGASLSTGIVVAPGAADAKVVLASEAAVNAVVVLDKAEVVVEQGAQADFITLAAAEASLTVSGTASNVTVDKIAEKASVTVEEGASVSVVEVAAPEAVTEIAGTVSSVTVTETATGAETTVSGTVSSVTAAAGSVDVTDSASVGSVNTADGVDLTVSDNANVGLVNGEDPNAPEEEDPTESEDPSEEPSEDTDTVIPDVPEMPTEITYTPVSGNKIEGYGKIGGATLHDANSNAEEAIKDENLADNYGVKVFQKNDTNEYKVEINGSVAQHQNGNGTTGIWTGVAIPVGDAETQQPVYNYYVFRHTKDGESTYAKLSNLTTYTWGAGSDVLAGVGADATNLDQTMFYNTIYFNAATVDSGKIIVEKVEAGSAITTAEAGEIDAAEFAEKLAEITADPEKGIVLEVEVNVTEKTDVSETNDDLEIVEQSGVTNDTAGQPGQQDDDVEIIEDIVTE